MIKMDMATYLGPATITETEEKRVRLSLPEQEEAWAALALSGPYQPVNGDQVLAIGYEENMYVIGILQGSGETILTAPGNIQLNAPRGTIDLSSGKGIRIQGPEVHLQANRLRLIAENVSETFGNVLRKVRDTLKVRARRIQTRTEESWSLRAGRIEEKAKGSVRIDGESINLG